MLIKGLPQVRIEATNKNPFNSHLFWFHVFWVPFFFFLKPFAAHEMGGEGILVKLLRRSSDERRKVTDTDKPDDDLTGRQDYFLIFFT